MNRRRTLTHLDQIWIKIWIAQLYVRAPTTAVSGAVAQNGVLNPGTSEVISKGRTGTAEAINEVINEAIMNEPGINKPRLVLLVRKSRATVERAIVALVAAGKIEHRGSKKTGGYYAI